MYNADEPEFLKPGKDAPGTFECIFRSVHEFARSNAEETMKDIWKGLNRKQAVVTCLGANLNTFARSNEPEVY